MSSWEQCPRPREQPEQTWEGSLTDLRPVRLEQSGQGWLERGKGREVSGTGGEGEPQEGLWFSPHGRAQAREGRDVTQVPTGRGGRHGSRGRPGSR